MPAWDLDTLSPMADEALRELERRHHAAPDLENETAWLRERYRSGQVSAERLWLAAYVGHSAAIEVYYGKEAYQDWLPRSPKQVEYWIQGLEQWGQIVVTRAGVAVARAMNPSQPEFLAALGAAERWTLDPIGENASAANSARARAGERTLNAFDWIEAGREPEPTDPDALTFCMGSLAAAAAGSASSCAGRHGAWLCSWPGGEKSDEEFKSRRPSEAVASGIARAARLWSLDATVRAVQEELSTWALGHSDPIASRVDNQATAERSPQAPIALDGGPRRES